MLGWLVRLVVRESRADTPLERAFMALVPLSMYATGATIGNGQLTIHLLPPLVFGLMLLCSKESGLGKEFLGAALFLLALAKPTVSAPFFWIVLFSTGRLRAVLYVVFGYVGLTLFATSFQESSIPMLFRDWLANPGIELRGVSNLKAWLGSVGLKQWSFPATTLALAALGLWTYRHRQVNLWLLLGVSALVARMWTYHHWYDDLLILLPMVALFRIAKEGPSDGSDLLAGVLFAISVIVMLTPGGLYLFPSPWKTVYLTGQVVVWFAVLFFLLDQAKRENARSSADHMSRRLTPMRGWL
jgi:hypothetical protein